MSIGLVGRKIGMSRVFTEQGESIPVTLIEVTKNRVTQVKSIEKEGYAAIQVTTGECKPNKVNQAEAGHFVAANVEAGRGLWEFRLDEEEKSYEVGEEICVTYFEEISKVDVTGTSKGKGFAGTVKRWNFAMQDATHGNSLSHRAPGSIGQNQTPGRVFKGKKMAGQMGNKRVTSQGLEVVKVVEEDNLLVVKGAVPGPKNGNLLIKPAVKG